MLALGRVRRALVVIAKIVIDEDGFLSEFRRRNHDGVVRHIIDPMAVDTQMVLWYLLKQKLPKSSQMSLDIATTLFSGIVVIRLVEMKRLVGTKHHAVDQVGAVLDGAQQSCRNFRRHQGVVEVQRDH